VKPSKKIAVVLGNEGQGVSKELLGKTYKNITIKTTEVESLNVGVAGSIIMYYLNNI
jgi:TrmH family RNA methyltransferase